MDVIFSRRDEFEDIEIFQLEFDKISDKGRVAVRGINGKYWNLGEKGMIVLVEVLGDNCWFELEWYGKQIVFKVGNGKYIIGKDNGYFIEGSDEIDQERGFYVLELVNRFMLVLRGEYGFVGVKFGKDLLESNYFKYDVFFVICKNGLYKIRIDFGKYWCCDEKGNVMLVNDEVGVYEYSIEFFKYNRMVIKVVNGFYIEGYQNGFFCVIGKSFGKNSLWEY